ncbi:ribosomal RNA-processing protein 8 [Novymonas esmeraldas]|uniref:Ribosomal RNA-processing protein 8 n=1 Tax=Novymonas esmeraldas TaxID=1808958 RepID=A0AAW0FE50_9TRYP
MLGGRHFQKKFDKKQQKKAAKKSAAAHARGVKGGVRRTDASTLKGPVVSHGDFTASRDSANNRKNIPFSSTMEERVYRREHRVPKYNAIVDPQQQNAAKAAGASSAAQRRRVLRQKGDEDVLDHFRERLNASTFRLLNEQVYNAPTTLASRLLRDESTFRDYHTGYHQQLVQWPMNPNTLMVESLLGDRRGRFLANKGKSMPGHIPPSWVVADMGCGEAQIAAALKPKGYTVHSFDFFALNSYVTVADTTKVPLPDNSVDVCIFSLSLMATDYIKSLAESFRILKPKRLLKVVEVRSRVPFPRQFAELVEDIGFDVDYNDVAGDYFVAFDFIKRDGQTTANTELRHDPGDVLVPSLYKKR